jgi:hypothetical protein
MREDARIQTRQAMRGLSIFGCAAMCVAAAAWVSSPAAAARWNGHGPSRGPGWNSPIFLPAPIFPPGVSFPPGASYPSYAGAPLVPDGAASTTYPAEAFSGYGEQRQPAGGYSGGYGYVPDKAGTPHPYTRYYCTSAQRYYPEVQDCDAWQPVEFRPYP